ncbi:hypothetical protein Sru01_65020 [Sphaerisporangium rufum]|uniref:Uncharacterized protein n=1 Tax=Sphaerisporangium rufum TaxID=1381558 RepID=A0A919RB68_9ACTN|nr:hypothetical protein Sru01_65020 [Sphaerisporangium rufum]
MPLGCRWCGHPPYAHDAASLPHSPHHAYEPPTRAQADARMRARRRLGLNRFPAPTRPARVHQPVLGPAHPARPTRSARPAVAYPGGRGRPAGTAPPGGGFSSRRREAAA